VSADERQGESADDSSPPNVVEELNRERHELLLLCTESKRVTRAQAESRRVQFLASGPELYIAAVGAYNVVIDASARRIQHGCRDFLGQARDGRLCKHVAGLLLAIEPDVAVPILRQLTAPASEWHLEVIAARGFGRAD